MILMNNIIVIVLAKMMMRMTMMYIEEITIIVMRTMTLNSKVTSIICTTGARMKKKVFK